MDSDHRRDIRLDQGTGLVHPVGNAAYVVDRAADGRYRVTLRTEHVGTLIDAAFYWMAEHRGKTYGPFRSRNAAIRMLVGLDQATYPEAPGQARMKERRDGSLH